MDNQVLENIKKNRDRIAEIVKVKHNLQQEEYEQLRVFSEQLKLKYALKNKALNEEIVSISDNLKSYQDELMLKGFINIEKLANDVTYLLNANTSFEWEILALAIKYKKRKKGNFGLMLIDTKANLIAVAKKNILSQDLMQIIYKQDDWLSKNSAIIAFMELLEKGDIVLLHIVEDENDKQKELNLLESGFNSDFDKYLLRYALEYNEKNPTYKYKFLQGYLDNYIFSIKNK